MAGRPLVNASLALGYAVHGLDPRGYHAANLAIHLGCGLLLFGLLRRSLGGRGSPPELRERAPALALAGAAIWLVHPLASECVAYATQRSESIMAAFYLITLLGVERVATAATRRERRAFAAAAVAACALGMASKEVMATAPLVALLYDRSFHAGSFREALRRRGGLHAGLAATWLLLAALQASGTRPLSAGLDLGVRPDTYLANQALLLPRYLGLAVWPDPLVLDYGWPRPLALRDVAGHLVFCLALVAGAAWCAWCRPRAGFPLAAGLLVLAPTTSLLPIVTEVGAERRMYLPLAGLVSLAVAGGWWLLARSGLPPRRAAFAGGALALAVAAALAGATRARVAEYRDPEILWRGAVEAAPDNPRALVNLGEVLHARGRSAEAERLFRAALALHPPYARAQAQLGRLALERGDPAAAEAHLRRALELDPRHSDIRTNLGELLARRGATREAMAQWREALERDPGLAYAANNLAWVLATDPDPELRDPAEALRLARQSADESAGSEPEILDTLAAAYASAGRWEEALVAARRALAEARERGDAALAAGIGARIEGYRRREPARSAPAP